ncbi:MAG: lipocalin-like domain-containing protein [Acidobacteria bacterium]|nr:lipocalin-like domain-containing protein [Acidobacteriota bacterium]
MKALLFWTMAVIVVLSGLSQAQSTEKKDVSPGSEKEKLVGAWRLAWIEVQGADGKVTRTTAAKGMMIYTADGRMSVQVRFPRLQSAPSNNSVEYAQGGYESSFGSYDMDEETDTVTQHIEGSNVEANVGKDIQRMYKFSDGHLILRSARPGERWAGTWERY